MLRFKQNDTSADLILTLTELITITDPNYLFVLTHVTTKDVVAFVKLSTDNTSAYKTRYDQFNINPSVLFADKNPGEWHYAIYQQASAINLDPALANGALEYGKLFLDRSVDFAFTEYDSPTNYKAYDG